jgi:hypothetical protein
MADACDHALNLEIEIKFYARITLKSDPEESEDENYTD